MSDNSELAKQLEKDSTLLMLGPGEYGSQSARRMALNMRQAAALLTAPSASQGQAVAWQCLMPDGKWGQCSQGFYETNVRINGPWKVRALCLASPPSAGTDAAREPTVRYIGRYADETKEQYDARVAAARDAAPSDQARDAERYQALLDDPESARHLLLLLLQKRGTQNDFRRMQDRIAQSKVDRCAAIAAERGEKT